ncbi:MAG: DMT family transporter [Devosiaceae bacterium]|nr:DMT family transporter [Devosiaceae bacterium MH13]
MSLWIPIVIAAAFLQNLRSILQKNLTGTLSVGGATFSRFVFAFPLALAYALAVSLVTGWWPQVPGFTFAAYLVTGAFTQIVATYLLIASFAHGPFAIGTAYSKTEALQAAVVALILLGEGLSLLGVAAILVGLGGVALMAFKRRADGLAALDLTNRAVLFGLGAGLAFAFSSVGYRGASLSLGDGSAFARAAWTLSAATFVQTVCFGAWLRWREPGTVTKTLRQWRQAGLVAVVGVAGSIGWFTALTLQTAALVKALAQVELVFSTLTSWFYYREPVSVREVAGIGLIALSVVMIVLVA